ncbi:hypothetical protein OK016_07695 [Vibrio chagasii]|nr:hypothetical protein [Vibrio chagasii]
MRRVNESAYSTVGDFTFEAGAQAVPSASVALPEQPTAIFCHNDAMAIGGTKKPKNSA